MAKFLTMEDALSPRLGGAGIFNRISILHVQFFRRGADIRIVKDGLLLSHPFLQRLDLSCEGLIGVFNV